MSRELNIHLYADDTAITYCCAPTLAQAFEIFQNAFNYI